ncbi:MAG: hypothetical protein ABSF24_06670 [Candidatus Bathyarchaeia archaeon]|jgi:hypothetical protein
MTQQPEKTKTSTRGAILGQLITAQRLQAPGQGLPSTQEPGVPQQVFGLQNVLDKIDQVRAQFRGQTGFKPGLIAERRALRRSEVLTAVSSPKTIIVKNTETEDAPAPAPPPKAAFKCPWENCGFETEDAAAFQFHVTDHSRFHPKSY